MIIAICKPHPIPHHAGLSLAKSGLIICRRDLTRNRENLFAFPRLPVHALPMLQPLALVFYERLIPGSQLVNRLQDLHYRVLVVDDPTSLPATARREKPLLLVADLASCAEVCAAIGQIKAEPDTEHLPAIAFAPDNAASLIKEAQKITGLIAVTDSGLLNHLEQLIDQVLQV